MSISTFTQKVTCIICAFAIVSCNKPIVDLGKLTVGQPLNVSIEDGATKVEIQDGHIESTEEGFNIVDNGEKVVHYTFSDSDTKNVTFYGFQLKESQATKISTYNDNLAFISFELQENQSKDFLTIFKKELGEPDSVTIEYVMVETLKDEVLENLKSGFPNYCKVHEDDLGNKVIDYPQRAYWIKNDVAYCLSLDPINQSVNAKMDIISKKALADKIIIGYHTDYFNPFN